MTDPVRVRAAEPLVSLLTRRHRPPSAAQAEATDSVSISTAARAASETIVPVEESADTGAAEDALHTVPEEEEVAPEETEKKEKQELEPEEKRLVSLLRARDTEVRAHEAAHIGASGGMAGGASYTYETGPDGQRYAVGGEVSISSPRTTDPDQALANAQRMRAAAMAPASPSGQDRAVASRAMTMAMRARSAIAEERAASAEELSPRPRDEEGEGEELPEGAEAGRPAEPARLGGPTEFGAAQHLHSDGCEYCSASVARFQMNL
jgi:hypothetical protein